MIATMTCGTTATVWEVTFDSGNSWPPIVYRGPIATDTYVYEELFEPPVPVYPGQRLCVRREVHVPRVRLDPVPQWQRWPQALASFRGNR